MKLFRCLLYIDSFTLLPIVFSSLIFPSEIRTLVYYKRFFVGLDYTFFFLFILGNASSAASDEGNPKFWKTEKRVRFFIRRICKTPAWFWFVIVLVFLNTCTVAVQHYGQPVWLEEFLCKYWQ